MVIFHSYVSLPEGICYDKIHICILIYIYIYIYICTLYTRFTRTNIFPRPLLQNKAMYISLRIKVKILRAILHGLSGGSKTLVVLIPVVPHKAVAEVSE